MSTKGGSSGQEGRSGLATASSATAESSTSSATSHSVTSTPSTPPTPATEISTLTDMSFAPPPETEENRRRRAQSDRASEELGRRLLRGWAMLGEECPNVGCYGVPLMRPPNNGEERSPRKVCSAHTPGYLSLIHSSPKECVICGGIFTTDASVGGGRLVPLNIPETSNAPPPVASSSKGHTNQPLASGQRIPRHSETLKPAQSPLPIASQNHEPVS